MIEHLIVWACLTATCKDYHPVATLYMFDTPQEIRPYCSIFNKPEIGGFSYTCSVWYSNSWEDTFIYYWPDIEKFPLDNDLCHRTWMQHELYRVIHHDSHVYVSGCKHPSSPK